MEDKLDLLVNSVQKYEYSLNIHSLDLYACLSCSTVCSDSPVQCCLIAMPQGNTVKKLTADRKTPE